MKIKSLELFKFKKFKINEIKDFFIKVNNRIQIIVGTNGSGKTSLLQELFPSAINKTLFEKNGYEALTLEKDGSIYELTYKYIKSKKEHSFKKDGKELNINHKFGIQEELISNHLGIDKTKKRILTCSTNITKMSSKPRKDFFTKLNPMKTEIIERKFKSAHSKVSSINVTLSSLYKRENELKEKKLTEEELKRLRITEDKLEKMKINLMNWGTRLTTLIGAEKEKTKTSAQKDIRVQKDMKKIEEIIVNLLVNLNKFYTFDGNGVDVYLDNLKEKIEILNNKNDKLKEEIQEKLIEVDKLEDTIKNKSTSEDMEESKTKVENLLKEKENLEKNNFINIFTEKEMNIFKEIEIQIIEKINTLIDIFTTKILSTEAFNKINISRSKYKSKIDITQLEINSASNNISIIENELKKLIEDNDENDLPKKCDKFNCFLYGSYNARKNKLLNQINDFKGKYTELEKIKAKYLKVYNNFDKIYQKNLIYRKIATEIKKLLNKLPTHNFLINDKKYLELLNTFPTNIITILKNHYDLSEKFYLYQKIRKELNEVEKELSILSNKNKINIAIINNTIKTLKKDIKSSQKTYIKNEKKIKDLEQEMDEYSIYKKKYQELNWYHSKIVAHKKYVESKKSVEFYEMLLKIIDIYKKKNESTLSEISSVLKEQESIEIRLNEEVLCEIKKLKSEKKDYELVEKGFEKLSSEYILSFINNIIHNVNFFIDKIFTYSMKINYIKGIDEMNFRFNLTVNDVFVDDISECSSGQRKIIDLCFSLALIIELNLQHLPFFVDEVDKALDKTHKQNLLNLFYYLIDENIISQLFAAIHITPELEGLQGDIVCLNEDNILLPPVYNEHVKIKK